MVEFVEERGKDFTMAELKQAVWDTKIKKASGMDGFPARALRELFQAKGLEWLEVLNWCLKAGSFPTPWKVASIAWIPKIKGDFRPICLLPVLGKILDRLAARRLSDFLERSGGLSDRQFGFRSGKGTIEAVASVVNRIRANKNRGLHTVVVTLDMKNAFNMAWHPKIIECLRSVKCPKDLAGLIRDFLMDRRISSKGVDSVMERGCPQGSSLGPVLWLLLMEGWFGAMDAVLESTDACQAFADDQILVLADGNARKLEARWERVWNACKGWARTNKLEYNASKTEMLFIPHKRLERTPHLGLEDGYLEGRSHIKYLGICIDAKLNWLPHVKEVRGKISALALRAFAVAGKTWGVSSEMRVRVYDRVVVPMLVYGAEIWGEGWRSREIAKQLSMAQRPFLLIICRAFRTAPTAALQVLAGRPPLHLAAGERWIVEEERRQPIYERKSLPKDTVKLEERGIYLNSLREGQVEEEPWGDISWDCDASVKEGNVGVALVRTDNRGSSVRRELYKLTGEVTVSRAEQMGLLLVCSQLAVECRRGDTVRITTDAKNCVASAQTFKTKDLLTIHLQKLLVEAHHEGISVRVGYKKRRSTEGLRQADDAAREAREMVEGNIGIRKSRKEANDMGTRWLKQEWQKEWDRATTGRKVYELVPRVDLQRKDLSWKATQLVTGHGYMEAYYQRFRLRETHGRCRCDTGEEDRDHVLWDCAMDSRVQARGLLVESGLTRGAKLDTKELVTAFNNFAEEAIKDDKNN